MGDRANVAFKCDSDSDQHIFFYTHWGGHELPKDLQDALRIARPRWGDDSYCCRIILSNLIPDHASETGSGISLDVMDNEHSVFVVDLPKREIRLCSFDHDKWKVNFSDVLEEWTFEGFVGSPTEALERVFLARR